jgi:hypothetical protein
VGEIAMQMKTLVESLKSSNLSTDKGKYNAKVADLEHVQEMDKLCSMYQQEQDLKEVLFYCLHERENQFVLSAYLLTWKNTMFLEKTQIDGMMELEERLQFQIK